MNLKFNTSSFFVSAFLVSTIFAAIGKNEMSKNNSFPSIESRMLISGEEVVDTPPKGIDLPYPIVDENDPTVTPQKNPFDLKDPSNIKKEIIYDPETGQYILNQTIGNQFYGSPQYMSFDEYLKYQNKKSQEEYWQQKSNSSAILSHKGVVPKVNVNNQLFDRLFGGTAVDIRPNGNIDLTFGGNYQNIQNPTLTEQQRKQGGFKFDMNIQMNVVGKIGDKLKLTTNYNTQSTFDFENQVKLEYTGNQDEIIKKIEAGNVSLPLGGSLITGSQSLFGVKTQLQFGRLTVTSVISQSKSKTENITIQGGVQQQTFAVEADKYDENRNFFLAQYFRNQYNTAMATVPIINSGVTITKLEVWVTNKTGATVDTRDVVAFMDLGESKPYNDGGTGVITGSGNVLPAGSAQNKTISQGASNDLYAQLSQSENARSLNFSVQALTTAPFNLQPVQDFEKTYARKLAVTEYTLQPQLGFIMLNQQLNPDEVLGVAYQYTYNGKVYQVGEFAQDVPPNADKPNVLFLKMLKSTSVRPRIPLWQLMMKNIYSIGAYQINSQDFKLDITYLDPGGGERRYIPVGNVNGTPLLRLLGLDRLNNQLDPQPDGIFDFIPNITINPTNGKVIFPVLEPFGKDLSKQFTDKNIASKYVYQVLYDSTKTVALQFPEFNRFALKGTYKSSSSSDISLGAFNVPQGSVKITAGGQQLQENVDFTVDYNLGRVKIINSGILNSGVPINVSYENNATFGFQTKTLFGTRLDYYINDNFKLGGTYLHLSERPYTRKLNVGDDPISNAIYGIDGSYHTESGFITRLIDKIPLLDSKEKSSINVTGEVARLDPGHSKAITKEGQVYIDDFEGTQSNYDLKFPFNSWALSSTPDNPLFPEAKSINDLSYGFRRAKLSWYSIDPLFLRNISSTPTNIKNNQTQQANFYTREIIETEIFKNKQTVPGIPNNLPTFDLNFEPTIKGPYNYTTDGLQKDLDPIGRIRLKNPSQNWGGIMRAIDYNDFEAANIEYIQLWVLDPYLYGAKGQTGDLYINLGNISEDILKDSRLFYENGLPKNSEVKQDTSQSVWSVVPKQPPFNNSFDTDPASRKFQDVGYDGRSSADEQDFDREYLNKIAALFGTSSPIYIAAVADPANDDYQYFLGDDYDAQSAGILDRYKKYNNPEGNSPISTGNQAISSAATNIPESEDLNRDNTLSETEEYFQYKVSLRPNDLVVGKNFVTDKVVTTVQDANNRTIGDEVWYQLKIPINEFTSRIGGIQDFKSIRFIRMYLTGFDTTVILRFAKMEFIRNQWRKYQFSLKTPGEYIPDDNSQNIFFNVGSVSLEENAQRQPVNYVIPPGVEREQQIGTVSNVLQNERALQVQVCNLQDGDSRAVYKTINLDMRTFKNLKMFVHAESVIGETPLNYGDVTAFMRLGSDFVQNYYEYEIPLTITPEGNYDPNSDGQRLQVWPTANNMDIELSAFTSAKEERNLSGAPVTVPYTVQLANGVRITIVGNPDLGVVKTAMLGVRNPKSGTRGIPDSDDGQPKCAEVWFNEMRLSGFDEQGGYAALARVDVKLADFGSVTLSGNMHTIGFGTLEQKLNDRYKDNFYQYDASGTFQLGKFIPKKIGIQLPMYLGISKSFSNPKYDPYELDVLLKDKLSHYTTQAEKDSARRAAHTYTSIKSLNFTNIRKISTGKNSKLHIYSPENLNATYAYSQTFQSNPTVLSDVTDKYHGEIGYAFPGKPAPIQPFNSVIGSGKYLKIVKDINLNLLPTNLSFRTAMDRQFGETKLRPISADDIIQPTYNKYFTWDRNYGAKLDLTKSIAIDFNAITNTRIDEDTGRINTQEKRDSIWRNIKNGGRVTHYHHTTNASYTLPINKIPILDWIQSNAKYSSDYDWLALPQSLDTTFNADGTVHSLKQVDNPLGNTISNTQNISLSGDFNFRNLYNKWKFLKQFDTKNVAPVQPQDVKDKKKNNSDQIKMNPLAIIFKPVLSLKKFSINYTNNRGTILPGFLPKPKFAGQDLSKTAPGWDFIFGMQPDSNWVNNIAAKGWMTKDTMLNFQLLQNTTKNLTMKASLEPIRDFNIDVNFTKNFTSNSKEYFKYSDVTHSFNHLNPQQFGTYSVSYIAIKTAFIRPDKDGFSPIFTTFENYREKISDRLQQSNPNSQGIFMPIMDTSQNTSVDYSKYKYGYGPYSQDVLIPAFIAAYTGKSPTAVSLYNIFKGIPAPNWRISYNGLSKVNPIKKIFSAFNLTHAYSSTFTIGSYNTALDFSGRFDDNNIPIPNIVDSLSGNFVSYYDIPGISISEQFSPLIGVDMTWRNRITTKFSYKKSRMLAMSFLDYRMAETKTSEVTVGLGYKWKNAPIPFKINGKKKRLKNDINIQCNFSFSDNITSNYRLDQDVAQPTQGMKTISISPAADYMVSSRLNVRLFFDKRYTIPATSASYPIRYTNAGITIRFTLAQ